MSKHLIYLQLGIIFFALRLCISVHAAVPDISFDFNKGLTTGESINNVGWKTYEANSCAVIAPDPEDSQNQVITLSGGENGTWMEYWLPYAATGKVALEWDMYSVTEDILKVTCYSGTEAGRRDVTDFAVNSKTGEKPYAIWDNVYLAMQHEAKHWYHFKIQLDFDNGKVCYFRDGIAMTADNFTLRYSFTAPPLELINCVRFAMPGINVDASVLLDNIALHPVYSGSEKVDVNEVLLKSGQACVGGLSQISSDANVDVRLRAGIAGESVTAYAVVYHNNAIEKIHGKIGNNLPAGITTINLPIGAIEDDSRILKVYVWDKDNMQSISPVTTFAGSYIKVRDFGAYPDDGFDDTEAVDCAIKAAVANGSGCQVLFEEGEYTFKKPLNGESYIINVRGANGILLEGDKTSFIIQDPFAGCFQFEGSSNITVTGITVDYSEIPWAQGTVTAKDSINKTFDMQVSLGGRIFDNPAFQHCIAKGASFCTVRDSQNPILMKSTANDHYLETGVTKLTNNTYRFSVGDWSAERIFVNNEMQVGDKIIINNRGLGGSLINNNSCANTVISNVTCYASPGCAFVGAYIDGNVTVEGLQVLIKDGRWISTNADGIHIQFLNGAATVKNNVFEGLSDDCINFYQLPVRVDSVISNKEIIVYGTRTPHTGETIEVFDPQNGVIRAKVKVVMVQSIEGFSSYYKKLTLESPVEGITGSSSSNSADQIYIEEGKFSNTQITGNIFRASRRYGLYLRTNDTIVENNTFEDMGSYAICLNNEQNEGLGVKNLIIKNNIMTNVDRMQFAYNCANGGAISITSSKLDGTTTNGYIHQNIQFIDNTITGVKKNAFYIESVNGVEIKGNNVIKETSADPMENSSDIKIKNCKSITIDGLNITDMRQNLNSSIYIDNSCYDAVLGINNVFNLNAGIQDIINNSKKSSLLEVAPITSFTDGVYTTTGKFGSDQAGEILSIIVFNGEIIMNDNIKYIGQTIIDSDGTFTFEYKTKDAIKTGDTYTVKIGGEILSEPISDGGDGSLNIN